MKHKVIILKHPLIEHKLAHLRNRESDNKLFRETLSELSYLMVYEITRDLKLKEVQVETPLQTCTCRHGASEADPAPYWTAIAAVADGGVA